MSTPVIATLSLHDALPISGSSLPDPCSAPLMRKIGLESAASPRCHGAMDSLLIATGDSTVEAGDPRPKSSAILRSEEHTSELQSRQYLVCRLLLEKKNSN